MNEKMPAPKPHRPVSVTLLALGVLTIASLNLVRLFLAIRQWSFLAGLPSVSPLYLVVTALIWTLAGWPLVWGLWKGKSWALALCRSFAAVFALFYWWERLFLFGRPQAGFVTPSLANLPGDGVFSIVASVFVLGFVFWTLSRKNKKKYFGVMDERSS